LKINILYIATLPRKKGVEFITAVFKSDNVKNVGSFFYPSDVSFIIELVLRNLKNSDEELDTERYCQTCIELLLTIVSVHELYVQDYEAVRLDDMIQFITEYKAQLEHNFELNEVKDEARLAILPLMTTLSISLQTIKMEIEMKVLEIELVSAAKLQDKTTLLSTSGTNPYVVLKLSEGFQKEKSTTMQGTSAPVWNEKFQFNITHEIEWAKHAKRDLLLQVEVYHDEGPLFKHECIGKSHITIDNTTTSAGKAKTHTLPLEAVNAEAAAGTLTLSIKMC